MTIQVFIEGEAAASAAEALLNLSEISGELSEDAIKKTDPLTATATVIAIVGGTLAIAEQIRKWYHNSQRDRSGKTFEVLISGGGKRVYLEDATVEEIQAILESLN